MKGVGASAGYISRSWCGHGPIWNQQLAALNVTDNNTVKHIKDIWRKRVIHCIYIKRLICLSNPLCFIFIIVNIVSVWYLQCNRIELARRRIAPIQTLARCSSKLDLNISHFIWHLLIHFQPLILPLNTTKNIWTVYVLAYRQSSNVWRKESSLDGL